ncbi:unnamed protein product [Arabidopsis arenosa]|uniref:Myb-like domain-containing protein n=1 Tax=Arabidopsis arenosa TaxID=38785 RepID=A0A8S1ZB72_ARAAE|nr:unnamed protein product [Arabidopsis arenosa]
MVSDIEDEISVEKNPLPIEEDEISVKKNPLPDDEDKISVEKNHLSIDEDEISVEKNPLPIDEDEISVEKNPLPIDEDDDIALSPYILSQLVFDKLDLLGEIIDEIGYVSEKLNAHCIAHCDGGDIGVNSAPNIVPPKKRHYLRTSDTFMARENIPLETVSDNSLPTQLHENLHQLQELVKKLKARNFQLDESIVENCCVEAYVVDDDQPKRVLWTVEEETMLKVGVERFSPTIRKNMPWKKILEMGKGIFHKTRNPSDLKDKWRNMVIAVPLCRLRVAIGFKKLAVELKKLPFPVPVKTNTRGQIPNGSPWLAISSSTEITAAFAAAKEEYIYDDPSERKGVEYPRLRYSASNMDNYIHQSKNF